MARVILAVVHKMTTGLRHIATEPANLNHKPFTMDRKRSPQFRNKVKSVTGTASDSVSWARNSRLKFFRFMAVFEGLPVSQVFFVGRVKSSDLSSN